MALRPSMRSMKTDAVSVRTPHLSELPPRRGRRHFIHPQKGARSLAVVLLLSIAVLGFNFGSRQLITNDDTRFPVMARDILIHGHWLLPRLPDGHPHLAKPPLVVWLIALASWPVGSVTVRTAVLPSLLEALGVVLLTYWIGRRLYSPMAAIIASLTAASTVGMYSLAHSSMPDMAQLLAMTAALGTFAAAEIRGERKWPMLFYALVGVAALTKGAAGFIPLAIALIYTMARYGIAGLPRLVSMTGWAVLALLAVPWWIIAGVVGRGRFVDGVVLNDQLLWYFQRDTVSWRIIAEPIGHAIVVLLPWCLLLPFAIRRALGEDDPDAKWRLRLTLVWLLTVFVLMGVSGQQRERYYLPLVPAAALLIGWWYSRLAWRYRFIAFATAWIAVVTVGAALVRLDTPLFNATTDLATVRSLLARSPAPVYAMDVPELVLSFNLDRPIQAVDFGYYEQRVREGERPYLIASDRSLGDLPSTWRVHPVAIGLATRRRFTVLAPDPCDRAGQWGCSKSVANGS